MVTGAMCCKVNGSMGGATGTVIGADMTERMYSTGR